MAEPRKNITKVEEKEETPKNNKKFTGILGIIITILKYLLFAIILGGFVVAVSIITVNTLQKQYRITNAAGPIVLDAEQSIPEDLDWYIQIGEIRGSLLDETRKTFIVNIYLGYKPGDQLVLQELIRKRVQIKERITLYFTSHYSSDLQGTRNFVKMKNELREIINRIMNNKIREVAFDSFQIIEF